MISRIAGLSLSAFALGLVVPAAAADSDQDLMARLMKSAPRSVVENATVMAVEPDGKMRTVKQGTNGFTCMDPGGAPMCGDQNAMEWAHAWQSKAPPPDKTGFIYMLDGDNGASNTDPWAKKETPDNNWIKTGSHVMVVGPAVKSMPGYPRDAKADPAKPYVMWPNTPYEHLMIPAK
jgi:hypothetical protein